MSLVPAIYFVSPETLAYGAASWTADEPRYGVFYKYQDRTAMYHWRENILPQPETLASRSKEGQAYFDTPWEAFGPDSNPNNDLAEDY